MPIQESAFQHFELSHHFTASGLVFWQDHILLVNHRRIGAWVPPGGHIEENELPEETVCREILEETGLKIELVCDPRPSPKDPEAFFLAQPLYVQSVKAVEKGSEFYHIDLAYLCKPDPEQNPDPKLIPTLKSNHEVKEARWIKLSELDQIVLAKNVIEAIDLAKTRLLVTEKKF